MIAPHEEKPLEWYFLIFGLEGDYEGGYYLGVVKIPEEYPHYAPRIIMKTKNGRF